MKQADLSYLAIMKITKISHKYPKNCFERYTWWPFSLPTCFESSAVYEIMHLPCYEDHQQHGPHFFILLCFHSWKKISFQDSAGFAYQIFRARPVVCLLFKPIRGIGRKARIPCFTPKKTKKKRLNLDFLLKWEKSDGRISCAEERNIYFFLLNISSTLRSHNIVFNKGDSSAVVSFFQKFV